MDPSSKKRKITELLDKKDEMNSMSWFKDLTSMVNNEMFDYSMNCLDKCNEDDEPNVYLKILHSMLNNKKQVINELIKLELNKTKTLDDEQSTYEYWKILHMKKIKD